MRVNESFFGGSFYCSFGCSIIVTLLECWLEDVDVDIWGSLILNINENGIEKDIRALFNSYV